MWEVRYQPTRRSLQEFHVGVCVAARHLTQSPSYHTCQSINGVACVSLQVEASEDQTSEVAELVALGRCMRALDRPQDASHMFELALTIMPGCVCACAWGYFFLYIGFIP